MNRTHDQHVEDGRKGGKTPKVQYMPEIKRIMYKKGREKISVGENKEAVFDVAVQNLLRKMAKGDTKAWELYVKVMQFGEEHQSIELVGKDGQDLIPARRLTPEEAKELLGKMNDEY